MNRVCQLLQCRYPIIEGGLAYVGNGLLAAAVSAGGGLGQVGAGGRSPEDFKRQIEILMAHSSQSFGVNIPISEHRDLTPYFTIIKHYAQQIRAVSLSAGNPRPFIALLHDLGIVVMVLVSTPEQALKAEAACADILICEGAEAGGHDGPAELTTFTLVPMVTQAVRIPVVAAGGIANARTAAAAICLGAEGVQLGTRFVATKECEAHDAYKLALVEAKASDTEIIERSFGRITRVLRAPFVEKILLQEQQTPGDLEKLLPLISGKMNAVAALSGRMEEGWVNCGTSVGLIADIPSATDIVQSIGQNLTNIFKGASECVSSSV